MRRLQGRVALITGGGSGLGRAAGLRLATEGAAVVVADVNPGGGRETCRQIEALGGRALFVLADVTSADDAERMAAGAGGGGAVVDISEEAWDRLVDLDLKGVYLCSKFAIPEMRKVGGGAIAHVSWMGGLRGDWGGAAFSAAKGGVINLTRHMAVAHAPENIRVNCICPGLVETPLVERWLSDPEVRESVTARHPIGRLGQSEELAAAVAFLASDDAFFITGAILAVDGGSLACGR